MEKIAEKVNEIFNDVLFKEHELSDGKPSGDFVTVEGVVQNFGFHPERLAGHKESVQEIINEMPSVFKMNDGGGMSFINLCMDKNGNQWGEHRSVEQLVVLAIGLKLGSYCLPREFWSSLPGGMPYIVFN